MADEAQPDKADAGRIPAPPAVPSGGTPRPRYARVGQVRALWCAWVLLAGLVLMQGIWQVTREAPIAGGESRETRPMAAPAPEQPPGAALEPMFPEVVRARLLRGDMDWIERFIAEEGIDKDRAASLRGLLLQHMIRMEDVRMNEIAGTHPKDETAAFYALERRHLDVGLGLLLSPEATDRFVLLLEKPGFYPPDVLTTSRGGAEGAK